MESTPKTLRQRLSGGSLDKRWSQARRRLDGLRDETWQRLRLGARNGLDDVRAQAERQIERLRLQSEPDHPALTASSQLPARPEDAVRLLSLNVAHGRRSAAHQALLRTRTARRNVTEIADVMRRVGPDVVALQEADGPSAWSGNFDHVATLAADSDLDHHYRGDHNFLGFGPFTVASGTALMSSWSLQDVLSKRFRTNWRDTKGFVVATVKVPQWQGLEIDVVSVHLDFLRPSLRRRQILQMINVLIHRQRPLVVLGDLNCSWPQEPRSMQLLSDILDLRPFEPELSVPTFPVSRPRRRLDWVLVSPELDFVEYHTLKARLSDHLVVVSDLVLR